MLTTSSILQLSAIRIDFTCVTGKLTDSLDLLLVMFSPYVVPCALGGPLRVVGAHVCALFVLRMDSNVCGTKLYYSKIAVLECYGEPFFAHWVSCVNAMSFKVT